MAESSGINNPTSPLGVRATQPPQVFKLAAAPSTSFAPAGIRGGDIAFDSVNDNFYMYGGKSGGLAQWYAIGGSSSAISGDLTVSGDLKLDGAGKQLQVEGGAVTDFVGQATLVSGTVTVANTNIAATDRIFLSRADENSSSALGSLTVTALTPDTSYVITALSPADGSTTITGDVSIVNYFIVRQL